MAIKKEIRFYRYYYMFDMNLIIENTNQQVVLNDYLSMIKLYKDYDNLVFPILTIKLTLNGEVYKIIRDNDVKIKITSTKKLLHSSMDQREQTLVEDEPWMTNEIFEIMDKNYVMFNDNDLNDNLPSLEVVYNLFPIKNLSMNKKLYNGNKLNTRLIEILGLIEKNNSIENFLIETPINDNKYEQIIIPVMNPLLLLRYLQDNYFIYEDGIKAFFDYNEAIIMNSKISNLTPQIKNDYRNVIVDIIIDKELDQLTPYNVGYKTNEGSYYYIKVPDTDIKISDKSLIKQEILGSKRTLFSKDEHLNSIMSEWEIDSINKLIDKNQFYYDKYNNPYEKDSFKGTNIKGVLNFTNLDIDTFKPNKLFYAKVNNKDYEMKIKSVGFIFFKDKTNGVYVCKGSCFLSDN